MGKAKRVRQKKIEENERLERQRAEKRADRRDTMKVAAVAVAILLVIAIIVTSICLIVTAVRGTGNYLRSRESITSEHFTVNNAMMTYFFRTTLSSSVSNMLSYYGVDAQTAMYYGLIPNMSAPLRDQTYSSTSSTWYDQVMNSAASSVQSMLVLAEGAKAAGITITDDEQYLIDDFIKTLEDTAKEQNMSTDKLLTENFGLGVKESDLRDALEIYYLSQLFYYKTVNDIEITDDEISDYYDEHKEEIDVVDYMAYTFKSTVENAAEKAENVAKATTEEEFGTNLAKELQGVESGGDSAEAVKNAKVEKENYKEDTEYSEWLFDKDTKVGDTKVITASNGDVSVYMLLKAAGPDESETKNVRHILFSLSDYATEDECKAAAEKVFNEFKSGNGGEEAFASLAERNSSDPGSIFNGGLYENVVKDQMVEEFDEWTFDENRKVGDCEIIKTSYGYHIMYFSGEGRTAWQASVFSTLQNEKYTDISKELTDKYPVTIDTEKLKNIPDIA